MFVQRVRIQRWWPAVLLGICAVAAFLANRFQPWRNLVLESGADGLGDSSPAETRLEVAVPGLDERLVIHVFQSHGAKGPLSGFRVPGYCWQTFRGQGKCLWMRQAPGEWPEFLVHQPVDFDAERYRRVGALRYYRPGWWRVAWNGRSYVEHPLTTPPLGFWGHAVSELVSETGSTYLLNLP